MRKLMHWVGSHGAWQGSGLVLPAIDAAADAALQRWCVVAGGLALLLSRASETERAARFGHSIALYGFIHRRLRQSQCVRVSPELISEVMHEISEIADPLTRNCLKACFHAELRGPASAAAAAGPAPAVPMSEGSSSQPQAARASSTGFTSEQLLERSAALRRKLAAARATGFAELK